MSFYKTDAIVLRNESFADAHSLVTLLTATHGKLRAVAKGARRPVSRLGPALLPFNHCRLLLWQGRSLDGISQAEVVSSFSPLREDLGKIAAAMYISELVNELVPERSGPDRETAAFFRLTLALLNILESGLCQDLALHYGELHMLSLAGFRPRLNLCGACGARFASSGSGDAYFAPSAGVCYCGNCVGRNEGVGAGNCFRVSGAVIEVVQRLLRTPPGELPRLGLADETLRRLGEFLHTYSEHVLDRRLKSRPFLDILNENSMT